MKHEWYKDANTAHLFNHLLLRANHTTAKWKGYTLQRGQLITSRNHLSKETGLSPKQVRTCLSRLEHSGEIVRKSTNKNTLITICTYDAYIAQRANEGQTRGQQGATDKNDKEQLILKACEKFNLNEDEVKLFTRWIDYKDEKGQAYTESSIEALIKEHEGKTTEELQAAVSFSMANNYTGLIFRNKKKTPGTADIEDIDHGKGLHDE